MRWLFKRLLPIIGGFGAAVRAVLDNIGRYHDATWLVAQGDPVTTWIVSQPDLLFYGAMAALALIGLSLHIPPHKWARIARLRVSPQPESLPSRKEDDARVWPPLNNREERALSDELSKVGRHAIYIACRSYEGQQLADSIHNVLNRIGWPVIRGSGGFDAEGADGIFLTTCDDPAPSLKRAIESSTSLNVTMMPITRGQADYREYETMLVIGAKTWRAGRVDP